MNEWHRAGRNIIGVHLWWDGKKGMSGYDAERHDEERCSVFVAAQGVEEQMPKVWTLGDKADGQRFSAPFSRREGTVAYLPSRWFVSQGSAPKRLPLFLESIRSTVSETLAEQGGQPPLQANETLQWL